MIENNRYFIRLQAPVMWFLFFYDYRKNQKCIGPPAKSGVFIASFRGFTNTASTFHRLPETRFQTGIEGEMSSFHP
jgi:hypothetical protein